MSQITRPGILELFLLLLVAAIWGSAFVSIKVSVVDMGAMWTATLRVCIGFLALLPFFAFKPELPSELTVWLLAGAVALLSMVVPFILISWAMKHVGAGIGSLLMGATPFIAMVIGHFATKDEKINRFKVAGVVFAITGIIVLVGPSAISGAGNSALLAQMAIIASGACYVMAGFIIRRIDMAPIAFTTITLGLGAIMLVTVSLFMTGPPNTEVGQNTYLALLWLGLFPTGFAYVMRFFLVKRVGVSTFALAMNTVPIFGVILAALLLGEAIEWSMVVALVLVLSGLMIARMGVSEALPDHSK